MPQKPYVVRKKRARRNKKLQRWHEKREQEQSTETKDKGQKSSKKDD